MFTSGLWLWIALFVCAIALAVFVSQAVQVGLTFADDAFSFKFEKLNPVSGLKNIFSLNKLTHVRARTRSSSASSRASRGWR